MYLQTNLKALRSIKNVTQEKLAKETGIALHNIGAYEEGRSIPKIDKICRIAEYFGVTIESLVKEDLANSKVL